MSESLESAPPPRPKHDPFAALRQISFVLYSLNRIGATIGMAMMQAILAWHVYDVSGSVLNLGFLGLVRFGPSLAMSMIGGAVADTYDRRMVMIASRSVPFAGAALLAVATTGGWVTVPLIFTLSAMMGIAMAFEGPARVALLPAIVKPETFENAVTVSNTMQKLAQTTGPALAGGIIALAGTGASYMAFCVVTLISIPPLLFLRYKHDSSGRKGVSIAAIKEGISFVARRQVLLGAMTLDMFAVIFGGAEALLPVYAADILHTGPAGYGILRTAMQVGAFAMSFVMVMRRPVRQTGRALIYTVIVYGIFTIVFGLARDYMLAIVVYALIGAADQVSVVMRQTTIQLSTPDALRGRVSSVNQVFVGASSQIGAMRAGFVAAVTGATFAVVSGGIGAIVVAALIAWRMPQLFNYEIPRYDPDHEPPAEAGGDGAPPGAAVGTGASGPGDGNPDAPAAPPGRR